MKSGKKETRYFKRRHARADRDYYDVPCIDLARRLLGQTLISDVDDQRVAGRIVETEAYLGGEDKASNSYGGRRSEANAAMYMAPGTAYVYMTYGMHHCINISSQGDGSAVLLRAVEPFEGLDVMSNRRRQNSKQKGSRELKSKALCNGPAKLCKSFGLTKATTDRKDLTSRDSHLWIELVDDDFIVAETDIVAAPRIGIDSVVKEWSSKPFRFYVRGNPCISVRNKECEEVQPKCKEKK